MLIAQERLRNWEVREAKKAKDYEKEKAKEKKKTDEQEREAKKLKEFLEDYDDERDDPKFYKGRELARRLTDRYSKPWTGSRNTSRGSVVRTTPQVTRHNMDSMALTPR